MNAWRDDSQRARIAMMEASNSQPREEHPKVAGSYLEGQVALITAGGGGIARATAMLFAKAGAKIVLTDIKKEAAESVAAEVRSAGGEASAIVADVLSADDCARVVKETVETHGKLNILINLVGSFERGGGRIDKLPLDDWDWMIGMNLKSVFLMSKYAVPEMMKAGKGAIVNTGTIAAVIARGGTCYGTGKSGVLSLTRAMAADYFKHGIRVNAVCPSAVDTGMLYNAALSNRMKRGMTLEEAKGSYIKSDQGLSLPEEIATSFLFLASDQLSRKVNGHILLTDNGFAAMRL
jgi:NAD(P)-dependent dehydrogenase (short-subunit alcohol dehydrogenase family)